MDLRQWLQSGQTLPDPAELRRMPTRPAMLPRMRRLEQPQFRDPEIGEAPPPFPFVRIPVNGPVHPPSADSPDLFPATEAGGFDWAVSGVRPPRGPSRLLPSMLARREPMDPEPWRQPAGAENERAPTGSPARVGGFAPPSAPVAAMEDDAWTAALQRARQYVEKNPDPTGLRAAARQELDALRLQQEMERQRRSPQMMAYQSFNRAR